VSNGSQASARANQELHMLARCSATMTTARRTVSSRSTARPGSTASTARSTRYVALPAAIARTTQSAKRMNAVGGARSEVQV